MPILTAVLGVSDTTGEWRAPAHFGDVNEFPETISSIHLAGATRPGRAAALISRSGRVVQSGGNAMGSMAQALTQLEEVQSSAAALGQALRQVNLNSSHSLYTCALPQFQATAVSQVYCTE